MQVNKTVKSPTKVHLALSADASDLEPIKKHVLGHFAAKVKVPGFRAGKAPASVIEKHVDQKALLDEFLEHALNDLYRNAVTQGNLRPANAPKVELKKFVPFTNLEFEAELEVIGEVKLPDYKNIKHSKKTVTVEPKDVNDVLENLRQRMAERSEVSRTAKLEDEVTIDFSGKDSDGKPINGTEGKDYPLVLGSNSFIPGFEDNVVGMKAGDTKEFDVTFPKDYGVAALQNKKVTFKVTAVKVQEMKAPKVDDDFASKVGPFKTVAELKADIKKQLVAERQQQANQEYENELVQKIVEKTTVEIPESLIDEQIQLLEEEEKRNLVYRGQTWREHLKEEGVTEEEHRKRNRPDAELRVKGGLVLSEIADREQITVGPEELELRIQMLKGQHQDPAMMAELDKPENQQDIMARLLTEKTIFKLVDYSSK
jgi:trigger factor